MPLAQCQCLLGEHMQPPGSRTTKLHLTLWSILTRITEPGPNCSLQTSYMTWGLSCTWHLKGEQQMAQAQCGQAA